jgi:DNA-binding transcriptional LysR family regulator
VDIRTLRYFVAAAETENLSRASERLNVVQSALSHQIHGLEKQLGVQLFIRTGRRVHLSEIGRIFLEDARAVLEAVDTAKLRVDQAAKGAAGELRIGIETNSSRNVLVSETLLAYRAAFPYVAVHLVPMPSGRLLEAIVSGGVDAGFIYVSGTSPELSAVLLQKANWLVALPRDSKLVNRGTIRLKDLKDEPFIWWPANTSPVINDSMLATCLAGGLVPDIVQEAYNEIMMINLVAAGFGICFVIDAVTRQWPGDMVIFRKVEDLSSPLNLSLVWRRDNDALTLPHLASIAEKLSDAGHA